MDMKMRKEAVNILKQRYSCRKFLDKPIEEDVLNDILEVGLNAATGGNIQAVSMITVRDKQKKAEVNKYITRKFVKDCDTLIFYILDYNRMSRWAEVQEAPFGRQYAFRDFLIEVEDVMCVAQSVECAATLMGIGSVYMGGVNKHYDELKEILNLPKLTAPILLVCMGYPDDLGKDKNKLPREVLVHEEEYHVLTDEEVKKCIVKDKYNNFIATIPEHRMQEIKDHYYNVTLEVNGKEWADRVVARIEKQGGINKAQNAFGKHYNPIRQHSYNEKIFRFFSEQGLHMLPGDDTFRKSKKLSD